MVSLAILAGMMTMIAMIFTTASKSSGKAQATTVLYRQVRQITNTIQRDLRGVDPTVQTMAIAGVEVHAYATAEDKSTGRQLDLTPGSNDAYRADVLMLTTQLGSQFEPYIYKGTDEFDNVVHVIYAHANFGKLNPDGTWIPTAARPLENTSPQALPPASQWHLARRVVGFPIDALDPADDGVSDQLFTSDEFSGGTSAMTGPNSIADVYAGPFSSPPQGIYGYQGNNLGYYYLTNINGTYRYDPALNPPYEYYLLDLGYWWRWEGTKWEREDATGTMNDHPDILFPLAPDVGNFQAGGTLFWPGWFYTDGSSRPWLDPSPPAGMPERLASYFLPHCSNFRVEFTYDDPREVITDAAGIPVYTVPIRWQSVPHGEKWIWSRLGTDPEPYDKDDPTLRRLNLTQANRWPRAVRITMTIYDRSGGRNDPITHTIIHTWN